MSSKTFIVTESGLRPIFVDEDGVAITLDSQPCKARKGKLHCYLDVAHRLLKTAHLHLHSDGTLEKF